MLSTKVSLTSISMPPPLFLWRSTRSATHPEVFKGLSLVGHLGFLDRGNVDIVAVKES